MKTVLYILLLCFCYQVTAQNFSSDSNLVFLENQLNRINIYINQSSLNSLLNSTSSDITYDSSMEFISLNQVFYLNNVGIRLRGNTSLSAPKKSFKLDFNSFVPGRKFLGFEKLNLKADYNSPNKDALNDLKSAFLDSRTADEKSGNNKFEGNTYYRNNKKFNVNYINQWGNDKHTRLFDNYFYSNGKFKENHNQLIKKKVEHFYGMDKSAKKIFFSTNLYHEDIESFINDTMLSEDKSKFNYELIFYNGDELKINVNISNDGWISFIDTWDSNWKVFVNKKEKKLMKLFDAYKSVKVESGISEVRFVYMPLNFSFK